MLKIQTGIEKSYLVSDGQRYPMPDLAKRGAAMRENPQEPHALNRIGNVLGVPELDVRVPPILARDSAWTLARRAQSYDLIMEKLLPVSSAITEAKRILANKDLRPEVVATRSQEALAKVLPVLTSGLESALQGPIENVKLATKLYREAWTPDPADADAFHKAREVRDVLRALPESERVAAVLELGKRGMLQGIGAIMADPFGLADQLPAGIMSEAESLALDAAGLVVVSAMLQDAHDDLEHIAVLAEVIRATIAQHVPGQPLTLPANVKPIPDVAREALAA